MCVGMMSGCVTMNDSGPEYGWCPDTAPCPRHIVTIRNTDGARRPLSQSEPSRQSLDQ